MRAPSSQIVAQTHGPRRLLGCSRSAGMLNNIFAIPHLERFRFSSPLGRQGEKSGAYPIYVSIGESAVCPSLKVCQAKPDGVVG
jgi:hypothetical protein